MSDRALRSDAVANRARIVTAARSALSGSNGSLEAFSLHLVAKAANVGQGTLYRHFATREHLLAEVYRLELDELVDAVPVLLTHHSPIDALTRWLDRLIDYARVKRGIMAAIELSAWQRLYADQHDRLGEALGGLLDQGKRRGEIRPTVDATDVILLLGALTRIPAAEWDERTPVLIAVIVDGLRAR